MWLPGAVRREAVYTYACANSGTNRYSTSVLRPPVGRPAPHVLRHSACTVRNEAVCLRTVGGWISTAGEPPSFPDGRVIRPQREHCDVSVLWSQLRVDAAIGDPIHVCTEYFVHNRQLPLYPEGEEDSFLPPDMTGRQERIAGNDVISLVRVIGSPLRLGTCTRTT